MPRISSAIEDVRLTAIDARYSNSGALMYPTIEEIIAALNKPHSSPEGEHFLSRLGLSYADLKPDILVPQDTRSYESKERGISMEYKDLGALSDIPYHDIGEGPWILRDVFFFADVEKFTSYKGDLPEGVRFLMSKSELRSHLGAFTASGDKADVWLRGIYKIVVNYNWKNSDTIRAFGLKPIK